MEKHLNLEEHFILTGSNNYQILFDASKSQFSHLIRGKFAWNSKNNSSVERIEFMLDNLSTSTQNLVIYRANWCPEYNRMELHIVKDSEAEVRTTATCEIEEGYDIKRNMELILCYYEMYSEIEECSDYVIINQNRSKREEAWVQDDKDGSILIGIDIFRPKP